MKPETLTIPVRIGGLAVGPDTTPNFGDMAEMLEQAYRAPWWQRALFGWPQKRIWIVARYLRCLDAAYPTRAK